MTKTELRRACAALCDECNGFERVGDKCEDNACPLYATRERLHDVSDAIRWHRLPRHCWADAALVARMEGRLMDAPEPTEAQKQARAKAGARLRAKGERKEP